VPLTRPVAAASLRSGDIVYRRRALIIGIAGQDGSLLAELLLAEGYEVFGVVRQPTSTRFENLEAVRDDVELVQGRRPPRAVPRGRAHVLATARGLQPASPSFVPMSWRQPVLTAEFAAVGCTALLEAIRRVDDEIRFYPGVLERDLR
jgi:GDPmannose 4,6-dehydratase